MLHPFLFIGVGGSGGKTLRTLSADLDRVSRAFDIPVRSVPGPGAGGRGGLLACRRFRLGGVHRRLRHAPGGRRPPGTPQPPADSSQEQPLSAIGFGRVSLGRGNLGEYAAERLARRAVDRILRQHLAGRPDDADPNHQVALDETVEATFESFLRASGLDVGDERGKDLLEGLRPTDRPARLDTAAAEVHNAVIDGGTKPLPGHQWQAAVLAQVRYDHDRF